MADEVAPVTGGSLTSLPCQNIPAPAAIPLTATSSTAFTAGYRLGTPSTNALDTAYAAAEASLKAQIAAAQTTICRGLCPQPCKCIASDSGYPGVLSQIAALIFGSAGPPMAYKSAGWSGGGTWTVTLTTTVTAKCV
jgi:hypothetical protein